MRSEARQDRRKVVVTLTQKAWQIGQGELKPYLDAVDAAARQLSNGERAVVVSFLNDLVDKIAHAPRPQHSGE
jgi:DNA-binding MarR family transcriptional regulator